MFIITSTILRFVWVLSVAKATRTTSKLSAPLTRQRTRAVQESFREIWMGPLKGNWSGMYWNLLHLAFRITNLKYIFQIDAPSTHNSALKIALKPLLPGMVSASRESGRITQLDMSIFPCLPQASPEQSKMLQAFPHKVNAQGYWKVETSGFDVTFGSTTCAIQIYRTKIRWNSPRTRFSQ